MLELANTQLTGTIPSDLGKCLSLIDLNIFSNGLLEGVIPSELGNLSSLETLQLAATKVDGQIPSDLGNLDSLKTLLLDLTRLSGVMPDEICALRSGNLTSLTSDCVRAVECSCCSACF